MAEAIIYITIVMIIVVTICKKNNRPVPKSAVIF